MERKTKVSIIVPIFNKEKYLLKCLQSIASQTIENYECILVDDGSTDSSGEIADNVASKDNRFSSYHKSNGGLSDARNFGLSKAKGDYTIFVDPDDWVEPTFLEEMYNKAVKEDADMVITDFIRDEGGTSTIWKQEPKELNHVSVLYSILADELHGSTSNKLVRKRIYDDYHLRYPADLAYIEDMFTICNMLIHDLRISYIPKGFYHYVKHSDSLTAATEVSYSRKGLESFHYMIDYFEKLLRENGLETSCLENRKLEYKKMLWEFPGISKKEFFESYSDLNEHWIEVYGGNPNLYPRTMAMALNGHYYLGKIVQKINRLRRKI